MSKRGPLAAAGVNGVIVLLLPGLVLLLFENSRSSNPALISGAVHARYVLPLVSAVGASIGEIVVTVLLAAVAVWRTWVHATEWQMHQRTWRGVAEAGAIGVLFAIVMLGSAALAAAAQGAGWMGAIVSVAFSAAIGGLVGLVVGLLLQ